MTEKRPYYSTRQIINVDQFLGGKDDTYIMCISASMVYALRKMAKTRLLWPSSYSAEDHEQYYVLPSDTQWDQIDEIVSQWIADSEGIEMCNQALINAIESISTAVTNSSCCYEGGTGGQQINGDYYWGSEPPLEEPVSFGPGEEFPTETEYNTHRCAVANGIVNGVIGSLNGFSVLSLASLVAASIVAGVVGLGLVFVPPVAIIATLLFTGFAVGLFTSLANEMEDNKEYLVCGIYNSTTATEAYDWFRNAIEELAIDVGVLEISLGPLLDVVMNLAPINTFNKLYTAVGLPAIPGDTIDCATCAGRRLVVSKGSGPDPAWDVTLTYNSTEHPYEAVQIHIHEDDCAGVLATLTLQNSFTTNAYGSVKDCNGDVLTDWNGTQNWSAGQQFCGASFEWNSSAGNDFVVSMELTDNDCTP